MGDSNLALKKIRDIKIISGGSPPDIDSDFSPTSYDATKLYVQSLYGEKNVSYIGTFNTSKSRISVADAARIYGFSPSESAALKKALPDETEGLSLYDIMLENSEHYHVGNELRATAESKGMTHVLNAAWGAEGRIRNLGKHAAGIIISPEPLSGNIPLRYVDNDLLWTSQWDAKGVESVGLIKMDFLGSDMVGTIGDIVETIKKSGKPVPNMIQLTSTSMDDKYVYKMLSKGDSATVFQLDSVGMRNLLKRIRPTKFDDIVATLALYRPGPMEMNTHYKYADRKNGYEKVIPIDETFIGTAVEEILAPTYGLLVYQEQVSRLAIEVAGMSSVQADEFRSAMGKKKIDVMLGMRPHFIQGGLNRGYTEKQMVTLWDYIEPNAQYCFNLSHSVSYAMGSFQEAFLKCYYPVEFMCGKVKQYETKKDKRLLTLHSMNEMGIVVEPLNINESFAAMSPYKNKKAAQLGFSSVNSVSHETALEVEIERETNGEYKDFRDFVERNPGLSSTAIQNFVHAGGFDLFGYSRKQIAENAQAFISSLKKENRNNLDMADMFSDHRKEEEAELFTGEDYTLKERLYHEMDVVGSFIKEHPVTIFRQNISDKRVLSDIHFERLSDVIEETSDPYFVKPADSNKPKNIKIFGMIVDLDVKQEAEGIKGSISIDDGTGYTSFYLSNELKEIFANDIEISKAISRYKNLDKNSEPRQIGSKEEARILDLNHTPALIPKVGDMVIMHLSRYWKASENMYAYSCRDLIRVDVSDVLQNITLAITSEKRVNKIVDELKDLAKQYPGRNQINIGTYHNEQYPTVSDIQQRVSIVHALRKGKTEMMVETSNTKSSSKNKNGKKVPHWPPKPLKEQTVMDYLNYYNKGNFKKTVSVKAPPILEHKETREYKRFVKQIEYKDYGIRLNMGNSECIDEVLRIIGGEKFLVEKLLL